MYNLIENIKQRIQSRQNTFVKDNKQYKFKIGNIEKDTDNFIKVQAKVTEVINNEESNASGPESTVDICKIPIPEAGNLFNDKGTLYHLVNGLINRDGFYIIRTSNNGIVLKFSKRDELLFSIFYSKKDMNFIIRKYQTHEVNSRGDKVETTISLYSFLLALGYVKDVSDYTREFKTALRGHYIHKEKEYKSVEANSQTMLQDLFGIRVRDSCSSLLNHTVFDRFMGTDTRWETKEIFFSFRRFIGCKLHSCNCTSQVGGLITPEFARVLDLNKEITSAVLEIDNELVEINIEHGTDFTPETLVNVIKLYSVVHAYSNKVSLCDEEAIFHKRLYTMEDYMADFIIYSFQNYVKTGSNAETTKPNSFYFYLSKFCKKAKEPITVPNPVTFESLKYAFAKDVFRDSNNYKAIDKQMLHPSYLGWISQHITSDSKKVGLTGCINVNALHKGKLACEYDVFGQTNKVILEPYQTYNKIIGFIDQGTHKVTLTLNGDPINLDGNAELYLSSEEVYDVFTSNFVAINSDPAKRSNLSSKAIKQGLMEVKPVPDKIVKTKGSSEPIGETVRSVLDKISLTKNKKIYNESSKVIVISATLAEEDGKVDPTRMVIKLYVDSSYYTYTTMRYILATSQHIRMYFNLGKPTLPNGYYALDDVLIEAGKPQDIGRDINIMFSNIDGLTYEDAVTVTSDFVEDMNFAAKLYFHEDLKISDKGMEIVEVNNLLKQSLHPHLLPNGLPKKGSFISRGQLLCKVLVGSKLNHLYNTENKYSNLTQKTLYSKSCGYVEDVIITDLGDKNKVTKIRVILSEIRTLRTGDKTGNGHGNKGVVSNIIDSAELVCNGRKIDMALNPLGTIGRMNIGQFKEMLTTEILQDPTLDIDFRELGTESKTIAELTRELEDRGEYKEREIIYKGKLIKAKFFIGKMRVYRTEHISDSKLNFTERPPLTVNGENGNGQRISELAMMCFSAYGAEEVSEYLVKCQSSTTENYKNVRQNLVYGTQYDLIQHDDIYTSKVNALLFCIGIKFDKDGIRFVTREDIDNLIFIAKDNITGSILQEPEYNLGFNIDSEEGYIPRVAIQKSHSILMPVVFQALSGQIPVRISRYNSNTDTFETEEYKLDITDKRDRCGIQKVIDGRYFIRNNPKYIDIVDDESIGYVGYLEEWENGYFAVVDAMQSLDMDLLSKDSIQVKTFVDNYGSDFITQFTLPAIPVPPVNLRPRYDERSAQNLDSRYRRLLSTSDPKSIWSSLLSLTNDMKARLTSHDGSDEDKRKGIESRSKGSSEFRDGLGARRFSNSGRSVAAYSFKQDVDQLSIPYTIAIGMVRSILITKMLRVIKNSEELSAQFNYQNKNELDVKINNTLNGFVSGISVDNTLKHIMLDCLDDIYNGMACTMTREPILRRQNIYAYRVIFNDTDTIKVNPSVCSSYNLDFDGDQLGVQTILDKGMSKVALSKMSPYNGIYDTDTENTRFKPVQDILLGLYKLTKYKHSDNVTVIYSIKEDNRYTEYGIPYDIKPVVDDWLDGVIQLSDTIYIIDSASFNEAIQYDYVATVGDIIFASAILGSGFITRTKDLDTLTDLCRRGITSKNNSKLIDYMFNVFRTKEEILSSIKRMNLCSIFALTYSGVTLNPSDMSVVNSKQYSKDEEPIYDSKRSNTEPLFRYYVDTDDSALPIVDKISSNPFFTDLLSSGAKGDVGQFLQIYDKIGEMKCGKREMVIKANFNRGIGFVDNFYMAMPVRISNINVQSKLGVQGGALRSMAVLMSNLSMSKHDSCDCKPMVVELEYDYELNGKPLSDYHEIDVSEDKKVTDLLDSLGLSDYTLSGTALQNILNTLHTNVFNGQELESTLVPFFKEYITTHNIIYKGSEIIGSFVLEEIIAEHLYEVEVFSSYTCTSSDGICKRCYGHINKHLKKQQFSGSLGINSVFTIGEEKVQTTLDSAKKIKASMGIQAPPVFEFYSNTNQETLPPALITKQTEEETLEIGIAKTGKYEYTAYLGDDEIVFNDYTIDFSFKENDFFVPHSLCSYYNVNGVSNRALEKIFINNVKSISNKGQSKLIELILSANTRFVVTADGDIKPYNSETSELNRYWISKSELIRNTDVITSLFLENAYANLQQNAVKKRKYSPTSVFGSRFSFDSIKESPRNKIIHEMVLPVEKDIVKIMQLEIKNEDVKPTSEFEIEVDTDTEEVYEDIVVNTTNEF